MNKLCGAIGLALCLASSAAVAEGYLGAGGGIAASTVTSGNKEVLQYGTTSKKDNTSGGFRIYGGYTAANWGAELGYYDFGTYSIGGLQSGLYAEDRFEANAIALSLVRNFPIGETFRIHAKLGAASVETKYHCVALCTGPGFSLPDNSKTVISPILGLGFSWAFAKNWAVRTDWDLITNARSRVGTAGVSTTSSEVRVGYSMLSANVELRF